MTYLCLSSCFYYIKARDLKKLAVKELVLPQKTLKEDVCYIEVLENDVFLVKGTEVLSLHKDDDFVKTKVVYHSYNPIIGFFINLIKPLKRRFYVRNNTSFRVCFDRLIEANLTRGERNRDNAYQWTNKKWKITTDEAMARYDELLTSIKNNGYDENSPMIVMINRKFGIKDQILQGHHRIGICKELGIKEVNICFWTTPGSFSFFRYFLKKGR